jgi:hypothetical protein
VRKPFLVCWKKHTPLVYKIWVREIFFIILHYKYPKKLYIYQKLNTNSCFAKLRAISNVFSFFYTTCSRRWIFLLTFSRRKRHKDCHYEQTVYQYPTHCLSVIDVKITVRINSEDQLAIYNSSIDSYEAMFILSK